jgi:tetratricopeptide (TPR) repeat protein
MPENKRSAWREKYEKIVEVCSFPVHVFLALVAVGEFLHYAFTESDRIFVLLRYAVILYCLWYLFRVRTRKVTSDITGAPRYAYSEGKRKGATVTLFGAGALFVLGLTVWYGLWPRRFMLFPRREFAVLVADFDGPDPGEYAFKKRVLQELTDLKDPMIVAESLGAVVTQDEGSARARELGTRSGGAMVIWGWYNLNSHYALVSVHVELLRAPRAMSLAPPDSLRTVELSQIQNFEFQATEAKGMAYLALLAVGALQLEDGGDVKKALADFDTAMSKESPSQQPAARALGYFLRGLARYYLDDRGGALEDYNQAIAIQPGYGDALNNRGVLSEERGELEAAQVDFEAAAMASPSLARAHANLAGVLLLRHEYDRALEEIRRALQLDPQEKVAFNVRGLVYTDRGDYEGAIREFNEALRLAPEYPIALNNRGNAYAHLGRFEQAIADYNRALTQYARYPEALNDRGYSYFQLKQVAKAVADYREALSLRPNYLDAHTNLAVACDSAGDVSCAVSNYRDALRLNPDPAKQRAIHDRLHKLGAE